MNKEQIEQIAVQATNNYFNLLDQNEKMLYAMSPERYMKKYMDIYNVALGTIEKSQNPQTETLASVFK